MMKILQLLGGKNRLSWRSPACFFWLTTTSTALVLHGTLTGDQWVSLAQWIGGLFMGTEAARVFAPKDKAAEPAPDATPEA